MSEENDMAIQATRRQEPNWVEQRASERLPVSLPAYLEVRGEQHSAKLHNVGSGGAMIEIGVQLGTGTRIRFSCGTIRVDAVIVWATQGRSGLKFLKSIADWQLAEQVSRSDALLRRREAGPLALVRK
jgi:hypothetical protein